MGLILQQEFALLSIMSANILKNSLQIVERLPLQFRLRSQYKNNGLASARAISSTIHSPTPRISNPLFPSSTRSFSSTKTAMTSSKSFFNAVKDRRSIYALNKESPISDEAIEELVKQTILHAPSFFNTQSARLVVLLKKEHDVFWDMVKEVLKPIVPEDQFAATEQRLGMFRGGYGTILFFEDPAPVNDLMAKYPTYADNMPAWSQHGSAMHQFVLWAGLEAEGFGANLQHYNPVIDQKAQNHWNIPLEWSLKAQLVFGGKAGEPSEKTHKPVEERMFVYGK